MPDPQPRVYTALLVDDERRLRARSAWLRSLGHSVIEARNCTDAWRLAWMEYPQILLIPLHAGDTEPLDLCHRIKSNAGISSTALLVLCGRDAADDDVAGALDAGADACLHEPVSNHVLAAAVRALGRHWDLRSRLSRHSKPPDKDRIQNGTNHIESETERQLRLTNSALRQSIHELEQFALTVSHELQEPLRMVTSFAGILKANYSDDLTDGARDYLGHITAGSQRMTDLVNGLLAYSRVGQETCREANCNAALALEWAIASLQDQLTSAGASVTHDALPDVAMEFVALSRVFEQLLSNAVKFRGDSSPDIHITAEDNGDSWRFCVADNGPGIAEQYSNRVFEVFKRLHGREVPGSGIGLALCRRIVESRGGTMWVESEPGVGSRFYFTVARAQAKVAASAAT